MKNLKKTLSIFLAIALILSSAISFDSSSVRAATPKLSQTVISLPSGTSTTLKDATEKLFLYTLYSRLKQIKTLYIVLLYAK